MFLQTIRYVSLPAWLTGKAARYCYLGILVLLFAVYVCQTSSAAGSGYEMRDLQGKVDSLREDIQKIEVSVAAYSSMSSLERQIAKTGMIKVENMRYLNTVGPAVAKK